MSRLLKLLALYDYWRDTGWLMYRVPEKVAVLFLTFTVLYQYCLGDNTEWA